MARLFVPADPTPSGAPGEVVLMAKDADTVVGGWSVKADPTASAGARLQNANAGAPKVAPALAAPSHYFEMSFTAEAGRPYHLWVRGKAENNGWANDSVHVQFDGTSTPTARPSIEWHDRQHRIQPRETAAAAASRAGAGRTTAAAPA